MWCVRYPDPWKINPRELTPEEVEEVERIKDLVKKEFNVDVGELVEAKRVWHVPEKVECITLGGPDIASQEYLCIRVGHKYVHVYERTPYHGSAGKTYWCYMKFKKQD